MKNVVKCYKHFFGYFNALKTHGDMIVWKIEDTTNSFKNFLIFTELKHSACTDYHDENFTIDCLGPCPCNSRNCLEDLEFNLKNTVEKTNVLEGTYILASEMVNKRPYWTLVDENLALWYDGNNWIINNETQIGSTQGTSLRSI